MIALVSASPGASAALRSTYAHAQHIEHWSPLTAPAWLARLPGPIGRYSQRRTGDAKGAAPLLAVEAALRVWAGTATDRRYASDFALRVAIDAWAAREVRRRHPRAVIAPSLAARQTFAAARDIGAETILLLDLPLLRALHRDLDRAAHIWPQHSFLRRFRAPSWAIARQEAERVLADRILVRGAYAESLCITDGIAATKLERLPPPPSQHISPSPAPPRRLRLAGLAAARHGIDTALDVARLLDAELVVRIGDGTEPADLARRPNVLVERRDAPIPVDAILCPAICETYPPELHLTGIPIIASPMASLDGAGPDPYDPRAFAAALLR